MISMTPASSGTRPGQRLRASIANRPSTLKSWTGRMPGIPHVVASAATALMTQILMVGLGGFVGAISRFLLVGLVQGASGGRLPFGTLAVNVIGCAVIGAVTVLAETRTGLSEGVRLFLVVGLLGGFTTFSAFGNETLSLLRAGDGGAAAANVLANVLLAIGAVWVGRLAVQAMVSG